MHCGSWFWWRRRTAMFANLVAALAVTPSRVSIGRNRSGVRKQARRMFRASGAMRSNRLNTCCWAMVLVKFVWMRISRMSDTISNGGLSSASA